jgi:hypothetical protein
MSTELAIMHVVVSVRCTEHIHLAQLFYNAYAAHTGTILTTGSRMPRPPSGDHPSTLPFWASRADEEDPIEA